MKLGIVVTDKMHATAATCLIEDALARDWGVRCFLTDDGVNLLRDDRFMQAATRPGIHLSVCELSVERHCHDLPLADMSDTVIVGGQYQDAELVRNSERVLVF